MPSGSSAAASDTYRFHSSAPSSPQGRNTGIYRGQCCCRYHHSDREDEFHSSSDLQEVRSIKAMVGKQQKHHHKHALFCYFIEYIRTQVGQDRTKLSTYANNTGTAEETTWSSGRMQKLPPYFRRLTQSYVHALLAKPAGVKIQVLHLAIQKISIPLSQSWPPQLVSQRHCHGSMQVPWTHPGCGMHLSQYWPCHPYWHLHVKEKRKIRVGKQPKNPLELLCVDVSVELQSLEKDWGGEGEGQDEGRSCSRFVW